MEEVAPANASNSLSVKAILTSYKILSIVPKKNGQLFELNLSGEEKIILPSSLLGKEKLKPGQTLNKKKLFALKEQELFYKAKEKALAFLARRPYTALSLAVKLKQHLFTHELIEKVIADLKKHKYLDDDNFVKEWIASQLRRKPVGRKYLLAGLLRQGIKRNKVEELLSRLYPEVEEAKQCKKLIAKLKRFKKSDSPKIISFLIQRGFSLALIKKALKTQD